jgi:hypothetical protein
LNYSLVARKESGVDDGFRISSNPSGHQQDPPLPCADGGKIEQVERKSATDCNQDFNDREGLAHDKPGERWSVTGRKCFTVAM